jgi:hypothetical protein
MGGGGAGFGGGGHVCGGGYPNAWRKSIVTATGQELKERGLAPPPTCGTCALVSALVTALVLTVVFWIVWELT